ncbi:CHAT domain-containing protein [Prosthecobacter sp.]|uniref:CHAT domain-containing protein n=1 Tax=Prosthecobacter sp. TaxID=1965333 RepID=UPI003783A78E
MPCDLASRQEFARRLNDPAASDPSNDFNADETEEDDEDDADDADEDEVELPSWPSLRSWLRDFIDRAPSHRETFVMLATSPYYLTDECVQLAEKWLSHAEMLGDDERAAQIRFKLEIIRECSKKENQKELGLPQEEGVHESIERFQWVPEDARLLISRLLRQGRVKLGTLGEASLDTEKNTTRVAEQTGNTDPLAAGALTSAEASPGDPIPAALMQPMIEITMLMNLTAYDPSGVLARAQWEIARKVGQMPELKESPMLEMGLLNIKFLAGMGLYGEPGNEPMLDEIIADLKRVLEVLPEVFEGAGSHFANLALALRDRHGRTGDLVDLTEAMVWIEKALAITTPGTGDWHTMNGTHAMLLQRRYAALGDITDLELALDACDVALEASPEDTGVLGIRGLVLMSRFNALQNPRDADEGIAALEQVKSSGVPDEFLWCNLLYNLGNGYFSRFQHHGPPGDLDQAILNLTHALDAATPDSEIWATILAGFLGPLSSRYHRGHNVEDLDVAIRLAVHGLEAAEPGSDLWATTKSNLAGTFHERYIHAKDPLDRSSAITHGLEVLAARAVDSGFLPAVIACLHLGSLYLAEKDWPAAAAILEEGIRRAGCLYERQLLGEGRDATLLSVGELYYHAAYAQARLGRAADALVSLEQGRARALSFELGADEIARLAADPRHAAVVQEFQRAHASLQCLDQFGRAWNPSLAAPPIRQQDLAHVRQNLDQAMQQLCQIPEVARLFKAVSWIDLETAAVSAGAPVVYCFSTSMGSATIILHADARGRVHAVPFFDDGFTSASLKQMIHGGDNCLSYLEGTRYGSENQEEMNDLLEDIQRQLGQAFLHPAMPLLRQLGTKALHLIPMGSLSLLPLHAAYVVPADSSANTAVDRGHAEDEVNETIEKTDQDMRVTPLCAELTVSYGLSCRLLLACCQRSRPLHATAAPVLLGVGAEGSPDIPFAAAELFMAAARCTGRGGRYLIKNTLDEIRQSTGEATHLHVASHGEFVLESPMDSTIKLSDGHDLLLKDFTRCDFQRMQLVVLSACETGMIDIGKLPDELVGFPAAFIEAGAAAVVSTLWPVEDLATALFMDKFYEILFAASDSVPAVLSEPAPVVASASARALNGAARWLRELTVHELITNEMPRWESLSRAFESAATAAGVGDDIDLEPTFFLDEFESMAPDQCPFAAPFYWAGFVHSGS